MSDDIVADSLGTVKPLPPNIKELVKAAFKPGDACVVFCEKCESTRGLTDAQLAQEGIDAKDGRFKLVSGCAECPGAQ